MRVISAIDPWRGTGFAPYRDGAGEPTTGTRTNMAREPKREDEGKKKGVSKTALVLGAAGLFLFIVGVKRRHRLDEEREIGFSRPDEPRRPARGDAGSHAADD